MINGTANTESCPSPPPPCVWKKISIYGDWSKGKCIAKSSCYPLKALPSNKQLLASCCIWEGGGWTGVILTCSSPSLQQAVYFPLLLCIVWATGKQLLYMWRWRLNWHGFDMQLPFTAAGCVLSFMIMYNISNWEPAVVHEKVEAEQAVLSFRFMFSFPIPSYMVNSSKKGGSIC